MGERLASAFLVLGATGVCSLRLARRTSQPRDAEKARRGMGAPRLHECAGAAALRVRRGRAEGRYGGDPTMGRAGALTLLLPTDVIKARGRP